MRKHADCVETKARVYMLEVKPRVLENHKMESRVKDKLEIKQ